MFFQAFFLPPWRSFLKSHWKCDESQVQELTLFYSLLFSADISETIKTQLSRTMKETISFPITDATEGNTRSGFRKRSHTWKEMALRLLNSRRNLQCMWQKCLMSICMSVHMSVYICVDTCCCCKVASVVSDSVQPHRWQPTRLLCPWDSPGKKTGVDCHFLLHVDT